jgi:hypothetical protein
VDFENDQTLPATATFSKPGLYVLAVDVFDGELTTTEEMPADIRDGSMALKYDAWLSQYFSDTDMENPHLISPNSDPDNDGHTNQQEFEAGTHPRQANSVTRIVELSVDDALRLHLTVSTVSGREYALEMSESLTEAEWKMLETVRADGGQVVFDVSDFQSVGKAFYRIQVLQQDED